MIIVLGITASDIPHAYDANHYYEQHGASPSAPKTVVQTPANENYGGVPSLPQTAIPQTYHKQQQQPLWRQGWYLVC